MEQFYRDHYEGPWSLQKWAKTQILLDMIARGEFDGTTTQGQKKRSGRAKRTRANKSQNIEMLPVHPGKTYHQLVRMDLTPKEREDYDMVLDTSAFYHFVAELSAKKFKKQRSAILGKIAAEDLMLYVNRGLRTIINGDAAKLICQAVSQRDEAFFKALGRALTGKKSKSVGLDKYNTAIARLIYDGNTESGRKKLKEEFPDMEPCFREYRKRLLDMLPPEYQYLERIHRKKQRKEGKKSQKRSKRNRT